MKNQYIGDVGDFGKYGLLRFLKANGIDVGVNWYLTPDDARTDGNHTEYLFDQRMRVYDPESYDAMQDIAFQEDKTIQMLEQLPILRGLRFYDTMMDFSRLHWRDRADARKKWHEEAMRILQDAALIFADPDNGLSTKQKVTRKDSQKYIFPSEIVDYYSRDQQVVYYHHRSRKNAEGWLEEKRQMKAFLPDAKMLALSFHRWNVRTYVFVIHEDRYAFYSQVVEDFIRSKWGTCKIDGRVPFTVEEL